MFKGSGDGGLPNQFSQGVLPIAFLVHGWVELDGRQLSPGEISDIIRFRPSDISRFGGEFALSWENCHARDCFGIMPGATPKGSVVCGGTIRTVIHPSPPHMTLEQAIVESVHLRSDEGVTALSGGIDSALVAHLAGLPCVAIGTKDSHDLKRAALAADAMGLSCDLVTLTPGVIEEALISVLGVIADRNPVDASIAAAEYCIAEWASAQGHRRILTGQGADELFGGYARYLLSPDLGAELERDFLGLERQAVRDQAVAALHRAYFSLPYLDIRVVRAAQAIPAERKVHDGVRKWPLRSIAERHIPQEIAWHDKKAMQYGSGVHKTIADLARQNGYKRSVQGYINEISGREHGN